ncbi:MAG: ATP-binding cassette domain-containing protein, partial [Heliobacteriaceae bacterium]|nr:ATP-binding cassette domain-containing protein [Heliobacteriaceae bacterium]
MNLLLCDIHKRLGSFQLQAVNLSVNPGEYLVVIGPSGTGKTVLLELIAGFYHPDRGKIFRGSADITLMPPEQRKIGFVYQDFLLFPHLNVKDNILFGARKHVRQAEIPSRLERLVNLLGITTLLNRSPKTLSGGEQQRVALARALIMEPEILLLDEPLSSLDPQNRFRLRQELKTIHAEFGPMVIHVTHDFSEAKSLA